MSLTHRLPYPLAAAFIAGKNVELRDLRMQQARATNNVKQRQYFVEVAREHHRMAMQSVATARTRFRNGRMPDGVRLTEQDVAPAPVKS